MKLNMTSKHAATNPLLAYKLGAGWQYCDAYVLEAAGAAVGGVAVGRDVERFTRVVELPLEDGGGRVGVHLAHDHYRLAARRAHHRHAARAARRRVWQYEETV